MKLRYIGFVVFLFIIWTGCKSTKTLQENQVHKRSLQDLTQAIENHNVDYQTLAASAKINIQSSVESGKAKTNIRIIRDSLIWMNIKKFGFEVARILIDPDSIFIVYRFEKVYEKGSLDDLSRGIGLDINFEKLQTFFVGNSLAPDLDNISYEYVNDKYTVHSQNNQYLLSYRIDPKSLHIHQFDIIDDKDRKVSLQYSDYQRLENSQDFSYFRAYKAPLYETESKLEIDISSLEFNKTFDIKFEIPDHYEEL